MATIQTRAWLGAPHRSLTRESYAARLLWLYVDERFPSVLPAYLRRLATAPRRNGVRELADTFARTARAPLSTTFHRFAVELVRDEAPLMRAVRTLGAGGRTATTVEPLAVKCLRLRRPDPAVRDLVVDVASGAIDRGRR